MKKLTLVSLAFFSLFNVYGSQSNKLPKLSLAASIACYNHYNFLARTLPPLVLTFNVDAVLFDSVGEDIAQELEKQEQKIFFCDYCSFSSKTISREDKVRIIGKSFTCRHCGNLFLYNKYSANYHKIAYPFVQYVAKRKKSNLTEIKPERVERINGRSLTPEYFQQFLPLKFCSVNHETNEIEKN